MAAVVGEKLLESLLYAVKTKICYELKKIMDDLKPTIEEQILREVQESMKINKEEIVNNMVQISNGAIDAKLAVNNLKQQAMSANTRGGISGGKQSSKRKVSIPEVTNYMVVSTQTPFRCSQTKRRKMSHEPSYTNYLTSKLRSSTKHRCASKFASKLRSSKKYPFVMMEKKNVRAKRMYI
jgi:hypothetical protein